MPLPGQARAGLKSGRGWLYGSVGGVEKGGVEAGVRPGPSLGTNMPPVVPQIDWPGFISSPKHGRAFSSFHGSGSLARTFVKHLAANCALGSPRILRRALAHPGPEGKPPPSARDEDPRRRMLCLPAPGLSPLHARFIMDCPSQRPTGRCL